MILCDYDPHKTKSNRNDQRIAAPKISHKTALKCKETASWQVKYGINQYGRLNFVILLSYL